MSGADRWIGVDGGGTGSRALVGDADGSELGAATGGPGLIDPAEPGRAVRAVTDVVRRAAAAAGATLPARGVWAGLAGAGREAGRAAVEAGLREAGLAERVAVGTDVEAAHADAFGDGAGIVLVAGTGSAVRAAGPGAGVVKVGGWGQLLGDEGGGYRIGLDGLRAVVRSCDGREPRTALTRVLLEAADEGEPRGLVEWAARATKGEIAALSVLVAREARAGDGVAARVIHRALGAIREHLAAALERVGGWDVRPAVAMTGGLIAENGALAEAVQGIVLDLGCAVHSGPVVPERGALRSAIRLSR